MRTLFAFFSRTAIGRELAHADDVALGAGGNFDHLAFAVVGADPGSSAALRDIVEQRAR
jgi:hypothetical protein